MRAEAFSEAIIPLGSVTKKLKHANLVVKSGELLFVGELFSLCI
jgi:hypothetical protein